MKKIVNSLFFIVVLCSLKFAFGNAWVEIPFADFSGTAVTTGSITKRCSTENCEDTSPPSFASKSEERGTIYANNRLTILNVFRDQDGFAVQVLDVDGNKFWIFEPLKIKGRGSLLKYGEMPFNEYVETTVMAHHLNLLSNKSDIQCINQISHYLKQVEDLEQVHQANDLKNGKTRIAGEVASFNNLTSNSGDTDYHTRCSRFVTPSSELGEYGKFIAKELDSEFFKSLMDSENMMGVVGFKDLCPNFPNLTTDQKKHFWAWTFMSIATVESKCEDGVKGGYNSKTGLSPRGLLQLELSNTGMDGKRSIYANRPVAIGDNIFVNGKDTGVQNPETITINQSCGSSTIQTKYEHNLRCGLDIMKGTVEGVYYCMRTEYAGRPPKLWLDCVGRIHRNSYWQELIPPNGQISRRIRQLSKCKL